MSVECPHEAERELRDEPPTFGTREETRGHTIVGDPLRDGATDAEVRDAIETIEEGDDEE